MTDPSSSSFNVTIGDVQNSQVAVGHGSTITVNRLSQQDNNQLRELFTDLRTQVLAQAPAELQAEAEAKVEDIEQAVAEEDEPDLGRIESALRWFRRRLPAVAGAVLSVVVHPIVGKLVQAGGDALVGEFDRRFKQPVDEKADH